MIRNIIFDMGNVLLRYDPEVPLDKFCRSEEEKDLIRRELFQGPEWVQGDLGLIRDTDRYELIKPRIPEESWPALENCAYRWDICMTPLPGAEAFLRAAKAQGYGVYLLSNASDAFYRYFPKFMPLDFFDGRVVSADIHIIKPDPAIYEYLLETCGLNADECLFLDDVAENVAGAEAVGIHALQFTGDYPALAKKLGIEL